MKRLAIIPVVVLCLVVFLPLSLGSNPLKFGHLIATLRNLGHPPVATQSSKQSDRAHHGRPKPDLYAVSTVAHPWKPGMPQWGVQVYWVNNSGDPLSYTWGKAKRAVNYIVGLHANSICISFPFYTPGIDASTVSAKPTTPSPARIGILIQEAHRAHLRVTVRPILDEASLGPPTGWRGAIEPAGRDVWFASYQKFLMPYTQVSQEYGAASFVVGTELNSMEGDPHWDGLVTALGRQFKGNIAYNADWHDYVSKYVHMPVNYLGVDAYFPVHAPDSASISELVTGWNGWLDQKSTGTLPRVLLSEVGIGAENGAYPTPSDFYVTRTYNPQVQANWYQAVCTVARDRDMAGLYVWSLDFNFDPYKPAPSWVSRLDFAGRPQSERALRACFSTSYRVQSGAAGG
jgi:hypothetical protein